MVSDRVTVENRLGATAGQLSSEAFGVLDAGYHLIIAPPEHAPQRSGTGPEMEGRRVGLARMPVIYFFSQTVELLKINSLQLLATLNVIFQSEAVPENAATVPSDDCPPSLMSCRTRPFCVT